MMNWDPRPIQWWAIAKRFARVWVASVAITMTVLAISNALYRDQVPVVSAGLGVGTLFAVLIALAFWEEGNKNPIKKLRY